MKKFLNLFLFISVFCFLGVIRVKAATLILDKTSAKPGEKITLTISEAKSNSGYTLGYDTTSLEITEPNSCSGPSIEAEKVKNGCIITFNIKKASLTNDKSVSFTLNDKAKSEVTNPVTLIIKANTVVTTSTTTTTQAPKSNNANLKTLEIIGSDDNNVDFSPSFSSNVYEYSATVDATIKMVTINATMEDSKANMVISDNAMDELKAGENNKITITITAEDGTKKAYVINIKREALTSDATLKFLSIKEVEDFVLEEDKFNYNVKIKNSVTKLTLDYEASSSDAIVSINGNGDLKNGSKVKILVTAEDGTKKEYILNIIKDKETTKKGTINVPAEKNPLIIMAFSMIAFGLVGAIIYVVKK